MKKYIAFLGFFLAVVCCCIKEESSYDVTLESLLREMTCRDAITRFPDPFYKQAQISSYDRRTVAKGEPGWWANDDGAGYERLDTISGRYEKVMCDLKGAGAVTRIWMTTKEKFGTMRIYLDGSKKPQIVIPAYDMKRFPIDIPPGLSLTHTHYVDDMTGVGGNSFFFPIPFAEGCKIIFEEPDITIKIPRYYHIGYRMYQEGTSVKTFTIKEANRLTPLIDSVSQALLEARKSDSIPVGEDVFTDRELKAGESLDLSLPTGTMAVNRLTVKVFGVSEEDYPEIMRKLNIEATFDGVKTVSAPLSDFSGGGIGAPPTDGWWLYSDGKGEVICRFPMPYRSEAAIRVVNRSDKNVGIALAAQVNPYEWTDNSLYFHTSWQFEEGIPVSPDYDSDNNLDWNFVTIHGRGKYVGDLLTLNNHAIDWYGEGDEKIFVDGESFPSHTGTGTEDYFNCSWAPVVPFLTPYGGAPRADEVSSHGLNAFLRTRILDDIPFRESFKFDIEMLSWHYGTVDYYTTAFWYGDNE